MNDEMFCVFLRDAPVEVSATLESHGLLSDVDAMTFRRGKTKYDSNDEYTVSVRHRGDWFMEKATCNPPKDEWDSTPKMRSCISGICERLVSQIEGS